MRTTPTAWDPTQQLLARLQGVIAIGKGWRARCPAHEGRSASLAIAQGDNGTLLIHCFAGCPVVDVLAAVGLQVSDLFVHRDLRALTSAERQQLRQAARIVQWRAALSVLCEEANVVLIGACQLSDDTSLSNSDLARLRLAATRLFEAQEVLRAQ